MQSVVPPVYIIIVNFNTHLHTIECLESLFKQQYQNFKVIVVDNSTNPESLLEVTRWCEGTLNDIETKYPEIVLPIVKKPLKYKLISECSSSDHPLEGMNEQLLLVQAKENNGFSAANNIALKYILKEDNFDWVWLLNSDTIVPADCLQQFVNHRSELPSNTGIVGTKLLYYYRPGIFQGIGATYSPYTSVTKHVGDGEVDSGQYDNVNYAEKVTYVIGASFFVSKAFIKEVGLMCEDYFFYFEELDWAMRGRAKGYTLGFIPQCIVLHKEGASSNDADFKKSILQDVATVRNRVLITKRFFPTKLPLTYAGLAVVILNRLRRRQFKRIGILLKAVYLNQSPKQFIKSN